MPLTPREIEQLDEIADTIGRHPSARPPRRKWTYAGGKTAEEAGMAMAADPEKIQAERREDERLAERRAWS